LAPVLGVLSFIGAFAWAVLYTITRGLSGMGDGAASVKVLSVWDHIFAYSGSFYLFLVFLSCFRFVRGKLLRLVGIVAHGSLAVFALYLFRDSGIAAFVLLIPFAGFAAGWFWLFAAKSCSARIQSPS